MADHLIQLLLKRVDVLEKLVNDLKTKNQFVIDKLIDFQLCVENEKQKQIQAHARRCEIAIEKAKLEYESDVVIDGSSNQSQYDEDESWEKQILTM